MSVRTSPTQWPVRDPRGCAGIHVNLLAGALGLKDKLPAKSDAERAALDALNRFTTDGFGYFLEQSTRPQTIGYSLLDLPVGLLRGCSTTIRTATTRSPVHSSTARLRGISPE